MKALYKGEAFSIDEILEMLQRQGLIIEDHSRAEHVLQNVSYTRLKNYLTALMEDRASHKFRPGTTFE
ncbi:MAG: Abi family protein, partial [Bacteroidales bacterium]|nr:Abi family protein [Candidatus Cryptobacteroides equifaecalis]